MPAPTEAPTRSLHPTVGEQYYVDVPGFELSHDKAGKLLPYEVTATGITTPEQAKKWGAWHNLGKSWVEFRGNSPGSGTFRVGADTLVSTSDSARIKQLNENYATRIAARERFASERADRFWANRSGGAHRSGAGYGAMGIALPLIGASAVLGYASKAAAKAGFPKTAEGLAHGSAEGYGTAGLLGTKIPEEGTMARTVADAVYNAFNRVMPRGPEDIVRVATNAWNKVTGKGEPPAAKPNDPTKAPKPPVPISH